MRFGKMVAVGVMASVLPASGAMAAFDLQVTEIWPGNEPGDNLTADWFEVTNFGDMAWAAATDGDLFFDDESADETTADILAGIASIAPGDSVIFVDGDATNASDWQAVWSPVATASAGYYDGSGLGQGGDAVVLFLDADMSGDVTQAELLTFAAYPDANSNGGQSYDVVLGAFSTVGNASGAVSTIALNDVDQPAIGSPGAIPEPASAALFAAGALALLRRR